MRYFALKIFVDKQENDPITEEDVIHFKEMINEKLNLRDLKHDNIISIKGVAYSFGENKNKLQLAIVENLMSQDLKAFLEVYSAKIALDKKFEIAIKICEGLYYMHYRKFSHNDIKPQNILINWDNEHSKIEVRLADLGTMQKEKDFTRNIGITLEYASPERILNSLLDVQLTGQTWIMGDIWSFGYVLFNIFCDPKEKIIFPWAQFLKGKKYNEQDVKIQIKNIIEQEENKNNKYVDNIEIPKKIEDLINDCLQVNASLRPNINTILERLKIY